MKRVNVETKLLADIKTREELDKYFQTERIKKLISDETDKRLKGIVDVSVNENTKNFYPISNAATQMRIGKYEGLDSLLYFSKNLPSIRDREAANQLYNQICNGYQKIIESTSKSIADGIVQMNFKDAVYREKYTMQTTTINTEDERYRSITDANIYGYLIRKINDKKTDLTTVCSLIAYINHFSNSKFRAFEFNKMNKWYEGYVKSSK